MTVVDLAPADPATGELLALLHGRAFAEPWPASAFHALLQIPGTLALVILAGEHPAGFAVARHVLDEAEIITIGVLPDHQRQGLARALMDAVQSRCRDAAVRSLFLEVAAVNTPARALYGALGFREVGRRKGYYKRSGAPPDDALVLRLALAPSGARAAADDDDVGA